MCGLVSVPFVLVLSVRAHVQYLLSVRPEIAIFQAFVDVLGLSSSNKYAPSIDYPELKFLEFVGEGEYGGDLCVNGGGLFGVGHHELLYKSFLVGDGISYIIHAVIHFVEDVGGDTGE